jgi:hypothetical protein
MKDDEHIDEPVVQDNETDNKEETGCKEVGVHHRVHDAAPGVGCGKSDVRGGCASMAKGNEPDATITTCSNAAKMLSKLKAPLSGFPVSYEGTNVDTSAVEPVTPAS